MSIKSFSPSDSEFPEPLKHLPQSPTQIYTTGADVSTLIEQPSLGIVGSRKVSSYGRKITADFAAAAARKGVVVVSGLALGVDSIAHQAALDAGGKTIAVLPSGIEKIYPSSHTGLARSILQKGGALITEYNSKDTPMRHQFIERNRIIAALSNVLLITEAAERSGSLHTARFALEQGKEVLAVPGNITSATSMGTNNLLKMGAFPVTTAEDIFNVLNIKEAVKPTQQSIYGDTQAETIILELLNSGASRASELLTQSQLPTADFQQNLTMLEIKGRIQPLGNDTWGLA